MRILSLIAAAIMLIPGLLNAEPRTISANKISSPPVVDGDLKDWGKSGWIPLVLKPAVENDKENLTGTVNVEIKTAIAGDHFYMAARWPDKDQNSEYKNWIWKRTKYKRGKKLDDMFAVRFFMDGEYDACMFTEKLFISDVWVWSAGRSNPEQDVATQQDMPRILDRLLLLNWLKMQQNTNCLQVKSSI
jgi:hypothetical protein